MTRDRQIAALVEDVEVRGRRVEVRFRCPASNRVVRANVDVPEGTGAKMRALATRSLYWTVRESVVRSVRKMLGWNFFGKFASYFVAGLLPEPPGTRAGLTEAEREGAVHEAFKQVQAHFAWDERNGRYVAIEALHASLSEFERLLETCPVTNDWDRAVLGRVLAEVARADGEVEPAESALVVAQGDLRVGSPKTARPPTEAELREVSPEARETILALAWALAAADHEVVEAEAAKVEAFGAAMGISPMRVAQLSRVARAGLVEQLVADLALDGLLDDAERERIADVASRLGFTRAEFEAVDAMARKRLGLV